MYGTFFKAVAKPGKIDELVKFLQWDAAVADQTEPDTLRFDVWPVSGEPDAVYVYEAYIDEKGFGKHKEHAPYQQFVSHIAPHVLEPNPRAQVMDWTRSIASNEDECLSPQAPAIEPVVFDDFPIDHEAEEYFDGEAVLRRVTMRRNASVAHVHFSPGVRTHWHYHGGDQLLWFIEGTGTIEARNGMGGPWSRIASPGDIVRIHSGVWHRHGASETGSATHIAITIGSTVWEERPSS
jgi:quercetin dioxygenase-like cupin family protein/quinol monooxygenase YgiN